MIDYKKYIGKNIILVSKDVEVIGFLRNNGNIHGSIIDKRLSTPFVGEGDWGMGWHETPINPYHQLCRNTGFIVAVESIIIFSSDLVEGYDNLVAKYGLRTPTLYDLL